MNLVLNTEKIQQIKKIVERLIKPVYLKRVEKSNKSKEMAVLKMVYKNLQSGKFVDCLCFKLKSAVSYDFQHF